MPLPAPSAPAGTSIGITALACGGASAPGCTVVGTYAVPAEST